MMGDDLIFIIISVWIIILTIGVVYFLKWRRKYLDNQTK